MSEPRRVTHPRLRAPLVGRDRELQVLEVALADAVQSDVPQMVTLIGPSGLGKTRLLREFLANVRARDDGPRVLTAVAREGRDSDAPLRMLLRSRLGLPDGDQPQECERAFRAGVAEVLGASDAATSADFEYFLGRFLGLQLPESPLVRAVGDDPRQARQVQQAVLRQFLELDARKRPLLIAFEDLQLAQAEVREVFRWLLANLRDAPILFVFSARPELLQREPEWLSQPHHLRHDIQPLSDEEILAMLRGLLVDAEDPPQAINDLVVELACGSPYVLEQLVRGFIDQGVLVPHTDQPWPFFPERLDEDALPLSVDDAIEARVADLDPQERTLLEMAAAIGGVFWEGALIALQRMSQTDSSAWRGSTDARDHVRGVLEGLVARDYLLRIPGSTLAGEAEYAFKHNLEREALQRDASIELLQRYHRRTAQWLDCRASGGVEEHSELLGQHFELGGEPQRAADHFLKAADSARERFALQRAADHFAHGLALYDRRASQRRLTALDHYGDVLHRLKRPDEALEALDDATALAFQLDLPKWGGLAALRAGRVHRDTGNLTGAHDSLALAAARFEDCEHLPGYAQAMTTAAHVELLRGRFEAAQQMVEEVRRRLLDAGEQGLLLARCHLRFGALYRETGHFQQAEVALTQALEGLRRGEDRNGEAEALCLLGMVASQDGRPQRADSLFAQSLAVAQECGDRHQEALALTCLGGAYYRRGRAGDAVPLLTEAVDLCRSLGDRLQEADSRRSLGKAKAMAGDLAGGFAEISNAVATLERAGSLPQLAVALRTLGEIAAEPGFRADTAAEVDPALFFRRSLEVFERADHPAERARTLRALALHLQRTAADAPAPAVQRAAAQELLQQADGLAPDGAPTLSMVPPATESGSPWVGR